MSLEEENAENHSIPENPPPNPIITINCGGIKFQTFRETLINNSEYFRAMLAGHFVEGGKGGVSRDEYFLDMNPKIFGLLLDRMRYGLACKLPAGDQRPSALVFAAEFLGVEYRNVDEIEREKAEIEARAAELEKNSRLVFLKEAGLVGFLVMCVDTVSNNCLARVIDVNEEQGKFLIHYEHYEGPRYDEWIAKDSKRISRNLQRCNCGHTSCPDRNGGTHNNGYIVVNPTGNLTTSITPGAYYRNLVSGTATTGNITLSNIAIGAYTGMSTAGIGTSYFGMRA